MAALTSERGAGRVMGCPRVVIAWSPSSSKRVPTKMLLSGLLVTELVYYFVSLSFVLPVIVGVLFTLLHALIQTYVLTMLTALYYGAMPAARAFMPSAPSASSWASAG